MLTESTEAFTGTCWAHPGRAHPEPDPSVTRPNRLPPGQSDLANHSLHEQDATNLL